MSRCVVLILYIFFSSYSFAQCKFEQAVVDLISKEAILNCNDYYIGKWTHKEGPSYLDIMGFVPLDSIQQYSNQYFLANVSDSDKLIRLDIPLCFQQKNQKQRITISNRRTINGYVFVNAYFESNSSEADMSVLVTQFSNIMKLIDYKVINIISR